MKFKKGLSIIAILSFVLIASVVYYQMSFKTLEEAIEDSAVPIEEIYYTTEKKGYTIIVYGYEDVLSAGLIEKTFLGYRWSFGSGSDDFNMNDQILTKSFTNLGPRGSESNENLVTLTLGVIYDDSIESLKIQYKDQEFTEATIIETKKGRIWFSFSEAPLREYPEVIRVYKDGNEVAGWY